MYALFLSLQFPQPSRAKHIPDKTVRPPLKSAGNFSLLVAPLLISARRGQTTDTMKHQLIAPIFLIRHASALYAAGQVCHTNKECDVGCVDAKWTVGPKDGGGFELACDTPGTGPLVFFNANCVPDIPFASSFSRDKAATIEACKTLGGRSCANGCVVSGKRSVDAATREKCKSACSTGGVLIKSYPYEGLAQTSASC